MTAVAMLLLAAGGLFLAWRYVVPVAVSTVDAFRHSRVLQVGAWLVLMAAAWQSVGLGYPLYGVGAGGVATAIVWHRRRRSSSVVQRWSRRTRRTNGVATSLEIARNSGTLAVRRKATTVRPSLAARSVVDRLRTPTTEVAVKLARVGVQNMWAPIEDVIAIFGAPRSGKSGWLAGRIIDAPGACLVTSTRPDLYHLTSGMRRVRGPVYVFNAAGLAGLESTITFPPITGCENPVTAQERATDMISGGGEAAQSGDAERWDAQSRRVLAAFLHAAAIGDRHEQHILGWVADPVGSSAEILSLLRRSNMPAFAKDAEQFITTNDKTRSSITSGIMPALGWLTSPAAAAAGSAGAPFDVEQLLAERATIYLLGAEESHTAPLICALTGHLAREARRLASLQPGGRLDPNFTLALDEAALISPVPLESWTADMGGRNVTMILAFQSRAQLLARWGTAAAAVIINNTSSIMLFGGTKDDPDLSYWSRLAGDRDEAAENRAANGRVTSRSDRKTPVFSTAHLSNLKKGRAVVFCRGQSPAVGRVQMAWERTDVRSYQRSVRRPVALTVGRPRLLPAVGRVIGWAVGRG